MYPTGRTAKRLIKWMLVGAPVGKQQEGQLPKLGNKVVAN